MSKIENAQKVLDSFKEVDENAKGRIDQETGQLKINTNEITESGFLRVSYLKQQMLISGVSIKRSGTGIVIIISITA